MRCSAACLMQACYSLWLYLMQIIATSGAMVVYLPVGERSVLIWVGVRATVRAEGRSARVGAQLRRCCSGECREAACVEAVCSAERHRWMPLDATLVGTGVTQVGFRTRTQSLGVGTVVIGGAPRKAGALGLESCRWGLE